MYLGKNDNLRLTGSIPGRWTMAPLLLAAAFSGTLIASPLAFLATATQGSPDFTSASNPFGIVDLGTGAFFPRGMTPVFVGLGMDHGTLYGVDVLDQLVTIDPDNGATTVVGTLGITSTAPVPGYGAFDVFGSLSGGGLYGLDWSNNLYSVNPLTGKATFVGPTGIPVITAGLIFATGFSGGMA